MKEIVHHGYHVTIEKIYTIFKQLYNDNKLEFIEALYPLIGLSHKKMIQVSLFHTEKKGEKYNLKNIHILSDVVLKNDVQILPLKEKISSFEIELGSMRLQIRVKPMNTFTQAAYKINCSVKYLT